MQLIIITFITRNMDYVKTNNLLFFETKHASARNHISTSTHDGPYIYFSSTFMATTGHHCMNKFRRNAFLLNMEETLAQQQNIGVSLNIMTNLLQMRFNAHIKCTTKISGFDQWKRVRIIIALKQIILVKTMLIISINPQDLF